jgi:hypothetical protein
MKKKLALMAAACIFAFGVFGCGNSANDPVPVAETKPAAESQAEETESGSKDSKGNTEESKVAQDESVSEVKETPAEEIDYPTLPLPEYHYYGTEDWAEYADSVCHFLVENSLGDEAADLNICVPVVLKMDDSDPKDVKLWGEYMIYKYQLMKTSLIEEAGGSFGGVAHLDTTGGSPLVKDFDFLEDGSGFDESLDKLFGKEGLKDAYLEACDNRDQYLAEALANYINKNGLYITQYQSNGWAPVPVLNAPPTRDEDQIVDHVSNLSYTAQYDMRQMCFFEIDDSDTFCSVDSEDWNNFMIEISKKDGSDMDSVIKEVRSGSDENEELERTEDVTFKDIEGCTVLMTKGPYDDGDKVYVSYFVPGKDSILVIDITSDYSSDEKKQMATDSIIENFLGNMELK